MENASTSKINILCCYVLNNLVCPEYCKMQSTTTVFQLILVSWVVCVTWDTGRKTHTQCSLFKGRMTYNSVYCTAQLIHIIFSWLPSDVLSPDKAPTCDSFIIPRWLNILWGNSLKGLCIMPYPGNFFGVACRIQRDGKRAMTWAGTGTDWAFSGFIALAHIQKHCGHQLIRSQLSSGEFAEWVCYWILGEGGKVVGLSFSTCGFTDSTDHQDWGITTTGLLGNDCRVGLHTNYRTWNPSGSVIRHLAKKSIINQRSTFSLH